MSEINSTGQKQNAVTTIKKIGNRLGIWLILIVLFIFLAISTGDTFLTRDNLINVLRQICVVGVVAIGATYVVCGGEIDLSSGSLATLAGCFSTMLIVRNEMSVALSIALTLLLGISVGVIIGFIVTTLKVPAFITTLGIQYILNGVVMLMTRGTPITGLPKSYLDIGRGYAGSVPIPVIILLCLVLFAAFVFKFTSFGRNALTVGENSVAAKLSGINVKLTKIAVFAIAGCMSSLGGIMLAARLSSGQPTAAADLSLQAMAAVFVGGTTSNGTQNGVLGTLAGALFIGLMNNGLNLLEVDAYWQKIVLGFIIIFAVALDTYRNSATSSKE